MGLTATEPQSGEVVDNPRRWSAALAERLSRGYRRPKKWGELRSCDVVWTTFLPPLIPLQSHFHPTPNRVKTTSRAPRLTSFFFTYLPLAPLLRCGRQGLSTTSPLRGSQAVSHMLYTAIRHRHSLRGATDCHGNTRCRLKPFGIRRHCIWVAKAAYLTITLTPPMI